MHSGSDRFFVLTGGPGSGKTSLIEGLQAAGFSASIEAGRAIIKHQAAISGPGLPWNDPALFAEAMLSWEMRSYDMAQQEPGIVFFDRGVPDVAGYLRLTGLPAPDHLRRACDLYRYNRRVFIMPPWPEIFRQDGERKQDFDEAERTYRAMVETYSGCGYDLVEVPCAPVEERVDFVICEIRRSGNRDVNP
jgi:predicted ATPase